MILLIKNLLREEKYTIEGAKKILDDPGELKNIAQRNLSKNNGNGSIIPITPEKRDMKKDLEDLRNFLVDLRSKI